ncbi:MAG: periplasmic heavy metal sensor [Acidobacteriota bacterium]
MFRTLSLTLTLAGVSLLAQPPRGFFPWWDSPMVRDLNLTEDQRRQVQEVVRDYRGKLIDARAAVEKAEGDVEDLFNDDQLDARRAGDAVDKLVASRGEMTRAFAQMSLKLRTVLTPQQWRELRRRQSQEQSKQGPRQHMMGPGGDRGMQGMPGMQPGQGPRPRMMGPGRGMPGMQRQQPPQPAQPAQPAKPPQPPKPPADETGSPLN